MLEHHCFTFTAQAHDEKRKNTKNLLDLYLVILPKDDFISD